MNIKTLPIFIKKYISQPSLGITKLKQNFTPLAFQKCDSIEQAKVFASKEFGIKQLKADRLCEYNEINQLCVKIHNLTEGQAKFPPSINIKKQKNSGRYNGEYNSDNISLIKNNDYITTLIHEIGHYNHEQISANYLKMGKRAEIKNDMLYPDYRILDDFMKDTQSLKLIRQFISNYATSSPCEFVAEMFKTIINGRKLPLELFNLYKKYDGPCYEILLKQYKKANLVI